MTTTNLADAATKAFGGKDVLEADRKSGIATLKNHLKEFT
jgi:hypothetical protein